MLPGFPSEILPYLSIDCVVFGFENGTLKVLLIERTDEPLNDRWALPGGFIKISESLDEAAHRILTEMSGLPDIYLEQIHAFGEVNRYPAHRVITIGFFALIKPETYQLHPTWNAKAAKWFDVNEIPDMPLDHNNIFNKAFIHLKQKVRHEPVGFELLPEKFTLTQIQQIYEAILQIKLDKRNFRKKLAKMHLVQPLEELQNNVAHRAARLYKFDKDIYYQLKEKGYNFEL